MNHNPKNLPQPNPDTVTDKPNSSQSTDAAKPWMKSAGGLRHLKKENARINKLIEEEFDSIEPEADH